MYKKPKSTEKSQNNSEKETLTLPNSKTNRNLKLLNRIKIKTIALINTFKRIKRKVTDQEKTLTNHIYDTQDSMQNI